MNLTTDQLKAVQSKSKLIFVNSGPGSGKTRVIIERIKYLVESGIESSKILAITFTNKAAKVMQDRLKKYDISGVNCSTMHSLAVKLMIRSRVNFSIYDEDDVKSIIKRLSKKRKITDKDELYEILNEIALLKDNLIDAVTCSSKYREIYLEYTDELNKNKACDFSDLILYLVKYTKNNELEWDHILVDEAQDLSYAQLEIVKNLYSKVKVTDNNTLLLSADLDQALYRWRNARPEILKKFVEENADIIPLGTNFRSTKYIVDYSKKLIVKNKERIEKPLLANSKIWGITPKNKLFYDSTEEANYVADECEKSEEIAILYRSNWMAAQIELELTRRGLKYVLSDSIQFLDRKEIKDVLSYIRVALNSYDMLSLKRSIQSPKRGVGDKSLDKLNRFEDILDNEKLSEYIETIYGIKSYSNDAGAAIRYLLGKTQYFMYDEDDRIRNLDQLKQIVAGKTLQEAMFELTGGSVNNDSESTINLMTFHSSKGTEFKKVIIIGCEEGITPHINSDDLEEERRLFYVGITRSKNELITTHVKRRLMFGNYMSQKPSRFLYESGFHVQK